MGDQGAVNRTVPRERPRRWRRKGAVSPVIRRERRQGQQSGKRTRHRHSRQRTIVMPIATAVSRCLTVATAGVRPQRGHNGYAGVQHPADFQAGAEERRPEHLVAAVQPLRGRADGCGLSPVGRARFMQRTSLHLFPESILHPLFRDCRLELTSRVFVTRVVSGSWPPGYSRESPIPTTCQAVREVPY